MTDPGAGTTNSTPNGGPVGNDGGDQIFDRGYRAYTGPRFGLSGSMRSVTVFSLRSCLGLGRSARHKILPWLVIALSLVPAMVVVGITLVFSAVIEPDALVRYSEYLEGIALLLLLFCGIVVPEVLVSDRRSGMLPLYLSTPLQTGSYLASKTAAVALALSIITIGPVLVLLIGHTFGGSGPDGFGNWLLTLLRIIVAGVAVCAPFAVAALAAACLTDRRALASVGVIVFLFATGLVIGGLVNEADLSEHLMLLSVSDIAYELVFRIYGERGLYPGISSLLVLAANLGWIAVGGAVVWWRYRKLGAG